jgi:isocitrate/isopropylmalate dehydrogenase
MSFSFQPSTVVSTQQVELLLPSSLLLIALQVTLIPGDGIGAEITESVKEIFEHVNAPIEWEQYDVSGMSSSGEDLFKQAMESLKRNRVGLKGML